MRLWVDGASLAGMAVSQVVALRGPGGLALDPPAALLGWLPNDVPACRGLAVAWLKSHPYLWGMVAFARKSGARLRRRGLLGLSGLGLLCLPQLAVCGKMVRAARDAELLWDKSP